MKKIFLGYAAVIAASGAIIGTSYLSSGSASNPPLENLTQPEFLLTSGITITAALTISALIHIIGKRGTGNPMGNIKSASTTGETSTISGFRVGTKTGTGSQINNDFENTRIKDNSTPNLK